MCSNVKYIFINRRKFKRWSLMISKCTLTLNVTFMQKSQMFKTLVERINKPQIGPLRYIGKVMKCKCLKYPCIIHLKLICMIYDQKKGWNQIKNLTLNHKFH
jgi:hypothetical protein